MGLVQQEELASAEALPAPSALDAAAADDGDDGSAANFEPTRSTAHTEPPADDTSTSDLSAQQDAAADEEDRTAERPAAAREADPRDAQIASLHQELHDLLQQVSTVSAYRLR